MIGARELWDLVAAIVGSLLQDPEYASEAAKREALIEFAGQHDLSTQQTATLFRVAAGELVFSPVLRWVVEQ